MSSVLSTVVLMSCVEKGKCLILFGKITEVSLELDFVRPQLTVLTINLLIL